MYKMDGRVERILQEVVDQFSLDLSGLLVYTEAAPGAYLYAPLLAAIAGAEQVIGYTKDSQFGTATEVERKLRACAELDGRALRIKVVREKTSTDVGAADIITNTGFVRPITWQIIEWMKPTAVVPLMWETWEFRSEDLDLQYCREKGILVLGTNEHEAPCDMAPYSGFLALKLLFDLDFEGYGTRVILLGGQATLGGAIQRYFVDVGIESTWFGAGDGPWEPYEALQNHFETHGARYDVIVVAEHGDDRNLIGKEGSLTLESILQVNPSISVGVISGNVDADSLRASRLRYFPEELRPFGYMSYQPYLLGPRPVLELFGAGLKVGESMARARLAGGTLQEAAAYALKTSPAMDFDGEESWL
jgi:hypothetical protein